MQAKMAESLDVVVNDYYNNLTNADKIKFRNKVIEETGMGYTTFYNKISGRGEFTKAELYVISKVISDASAN